MGFVQVCQRSFSGNRKLAVVHRVWLRKMVQTHNGRKRLEYNMGFEYDEQMCYVGLR